MRHPILACFGMLTFIGATALACATSEAPNIPEIIRERNGTDPVDSGVSTEQADPEPEPTVKPPVAPPPVVFDASAPPADAGDDDDDNGGTDCDPSNTQYGLEAILAEAQGGATSCPNGGSDCDPSQCCYSATGGISIPGLPSMSFCVSK